MQVNKINKNSEKIKCFFNNIYKHYDITNNISSAGMTPYWRYRITNIYKNIIKKTHSKKLLDIAIGTGTSIKGIYNENIKIYGVDITENMLKIAQKKYPKVKLKVGNVYKLPYKNNEFDIVASQFSVRNFGYINKALKEMFRVLKPNGYLIITEFSVPKSFIFRKLYYFYISKILVRFAKIINKTTNPFLYFVESVIGWHKPNDFKKIIEKAKFKNVKYKLFTNGVVAVHIGQK